MERFKAEQWPCDPLDEAMILLDYVVEIFGLNDTDDPTNSCEFEDDIEALQASQIGATLVDGNTVRDTVGANSTLEEPSHGGGDAAH